MARARRRRRVCSFRQRARVLPSSRREGGTYGIALYPFLLLVSAWRCTFGIAGLRKVDKAELKLVIRLSAAARPGEMGAAQLSADPIRREARGRAPPGEQHKKHNTIVRI